MTTGHGADNGEEALTGRPREYAHVSDAVPEPEPVLGAHETYAKGEIGSIGQLVGDIAGDLSALIRQEVALAKAEAQQSASQAGKGAGLLAGAGLAGWFALLFLSIALWWALGSWMDNRGWAAVIVAVIWGILAAILAAGGRTQLKHVKGLPRTVETAKKVPDALKGNEEHA
ncbi:phage holin family protein [Janibacter indicus]|uniref:Phage holin family protein n=1 Tax=Janibacter indicus TaxID=857417 RepID=A0A7L9IZT1_9MICO|nr:phage holin family protein [Janibacter indicus]QOK22397.1 phage holin family protein [Janibacter indicus]